MVESTLRRRLVGDAAGCDDLPEVESPVVRNVVAGDFSLRPAPPHEVRDLNLHAPRYDDQQLTYARDFLPS